MIESGEKARERRAMGQAVSAKERHEWFGKRGEPFVKREQGWLPRENIADEHGNEIDEVVMAKAGASETHLLLDGCEHAGMREHVCNRCYFSHPDWHGGLRVRRESFR